MKQPYLALKQSFYLLTKPRAATEDARRQEFVLNVLLLSTLPLAVIATIQTSMGQFIRGGDFQGAPPLAIILVVLALLGLYVLSRSGHAKLAACLFVGSFIVIAAANAYTWGISLPAAPLVFVLVIVMSGILLGTRCSLIVTAVVSTVMLVLGYLESRGITHHDLSWIEQPVSIADASVYVFIWVIIALVSWLSNREIERSLQRARASEAALAKQRDLLEVRVEERTRELKQAQLEKILQLNRFADFGRISSEFFHDIINPLTAVSLNLEQLSTKRRSELLQEAIKGVKHIEDFAQAARKQVQNRTDDLHLFSPAKSAYEVVELLESKARSAGVAITTEFDERIRLYGSPTKFHQMLSNVIANAIDAYETTPLEHRQVTVSITHRNRTCHITVKDRGIGIPADQLGSIFDPFFTTKPVEKGTGIGLLIVKQVVEGDFRGQVKVASTPSLGTIFTILLPTAKQ